MHAHPSLLPVFETFNPKCCTSQDVKCPSCPCSCTRTSEVVQIVDPARLRKMIPPCIKLHQVSGTCHHTRNNGEEGKGHTSLLGDKTQCGGSIALYCVFFSIMWGYIHALAYNYIIFYMLEVARVCQQLFSFYEGARRGTKGPRGA